MDDTTRGLNDERDLSGRADERTRDLDAASPAVPPRPGARTTASPSPRGTASRKKSAGGDLDPDTDRRTREIQAEIAETREELSETIDAIQEKLRPSNLVSEATDKVKHATTERVRHMADSATETAQGVMRQTRDTATDMIEGVRHNPIPALMIGVGIAWFLIDRSRDRGDGRSTSYGRRNWSSDAEPRDRPKRSAGGYYRSQQVASGTGVDLDSDYAHGNDDDSYAEGLRDLGQRASGMADEARGTLRRTSYQAQSGLKRLLHGNPLLVGAAAVVVGAAVGAALPETERENEMMGETRDQLVDRAQEAVRTAATAAHDATQDAVGNVVGQVAERVTGSVPGGGTSGS